MKLTDKQVLEKIIVFCESIVKLENKQYNFDENIEIAEEILKMINKQ